MASGLTLAEQFPGVRPWPTYSVTVMHVADGSVSDLSRAVESLDVSIGVGDVVGTATVNLAYGKNLAPGIAMAKVSAGDSVTIAQVGATFSAILFVGTVSAPRESTRGPMMRMEMEARDVAGDVLCRQVDYAITVPTLASAVVDGLLNQWAPTVPRTVEASAYQVFPFEFRSTSIFEILAYVSFLSGERYTTFDGTLRWFAPAKRTTATRTLTTALPDPTIVRGTAKFDSDLTRKFTRVRVVTKGDPSAPLTHVVDGDAASNVHPLPFRPADPLSAAQIVVEVRDRITGTLTPLTVGIDSAGRLDGVYGGGLPALTASTPPIRFKGGPIDGGTGYSPDGTNYIVMNPTIYTAAGGDPAKAPDVPTIGIRIGALTGGGGTGGNGPDCDALVGVDPRGAPYVRTAQPLTPQQELVVTYRRDAPQSVEVSDMTALAANGEGRMTVLGARASGTAAAIQLAAATLDDLARPVFRGACETNLHNDAEMANPVGRPVRIDVAEQGLSTTAVVTGMGVSWQTGEPVRRRLSFGPPEQADVLEQIVRDQYERLRLIEGQAVLSEATQATTPF